MAISLSRDGIPSGILPLSCRGRRRSLLRDLDLELDLESRRLRDLDLERRPRDLERSLLFLCLEPERRRLRP